MTEQKAQEMLSLDKLKDHCERQCLRHVGSYRPVTPVCLLTSWVHALVDDVTVYLLSDEEVDYEIQ